MFLDYIALFLCGKHTEKFFEKLAAPKKSHLGHKFFMVPGNFLIE